MKKILIALVALLISAGGAFLAYQNMPIKRHARHLIKARLLAGEGNLNAARLEYEKAYNITDTFTPYVSMEVLRIMNRLHLQDRDMAAALENTRKFTESNPEYVDGWVMLAELAFQSREPATAFDATGKALTLEPGNFPARLLLAKVRTQQGRLDLAEEQLRALHKFAPDSVDALVPLAENLLRQGQMQESRVFARKVLERNPKNGMARLLLVDGYLLERKADSAKEILDSWKEADPSLGMPIAIRKANLSSLLDRDAEAVETLRPYLENKAENLPAFSELALMHARKGRFDSSIAIYSRMEELSPAARSEILILKSYLLLKVQNPARALEALKTLEIGRRAESPASLLAATHLAMGQDHKIPELIIAQPDSTRGRLQAFVSQLPSDKKFIGQWALINYFQTNRQTYPVFLAVRELHSKWPKNPMAIGLYSSQLTSARQYKEAAAVLSTLDKPTLPQGMALMTLLLRSGQGGKAKAKAEQLLAEHPRQPGLNLFLGDYHMSLKEKDKGLEFYEKELAIDTGNLVAINNIAWEYGIGRQDLVKAKPYLDKLRSRKALDPRILDTIGWILAKNGSAEGKEYLLTAVNIVPDNPVFNYHLGWHLAKSGDKEGARKHIQTALESKFPFEERAEATQLLAGL